MLLGDILNGKEKSHLVVIHDSISQSGRPLLYCFVKSLLKSADYVHALLWDVPTDQFLSAFDPQMRERIFCYDGFTDPLGWNLKCGDSDKHVCTIHQNSNLAQIVKSKLNSDGFVSNSDSVIKVAIVIDSLSKLLLWKPTSAVCSSLHQLYSSSSTNSQAGYQVVQVVCLVHSDLHNDQSLTAVNFLASSILMLTRENQQQNTDETVSWCRLLHKRKTGKVLRKVESITINDEYEMTEHEEREWNASRSVKYNEPVAEVDPTQNLTFNLKLTDDERQARSNLQLPYMYHEKKTSEVTVHPSGEGKVFYQPDEADDFDDEDPDDDLDI